MLSLADSLKVPLDAVTQTFGILAVRGAGKSNCAAVMAEQMFAAGLPFVVVDPVGSWWGLRQADLAAVAGGGRVVATIRGMATLGSSFQPLPTGAALRDFWRQKLPSGEWRVLAELIGAYPVTIDRDAVSAMTGYKRQTRDAYLLRLASRELITREGTGLVRASDALFD